MPIRIGLNTGLVVFGPVADKLRMDSTAIGDAANIAARLQEAPSRATSSSARQPSGWRAGYIVAEPIGALRLKGKTETVSGAPAHRGAVGTARVSTSCLVWGREFLSAATGNSPCSTSCCPRPNRATDSGRHRGRPGIGKSRLITEFHRSLTGGRPAGARAGAFPTAPPSLIC